MFSYSYTLGSIIVILAVLFALIIAIPLIPIDKPRGNGSSKIQQGSRLS